MALQQEWILRKIGKNTTLWSLQDDNHDDLAFLVRVIKRRFTIFCGILRNIRTNRTFAQPCDRDKMMYGNADVHLLEAVSVAL